MSDDKVCIERKKLISVLRDLEMLVVSLDRIGSAAAELTPEDYRRLSSEFLDDWDVTRRLARARTVLSEPFSDWVDEHGDDKLERELANVEHWTLDTPKPSIGGQ